MAEKRSRQATQDLQITGSDGVMYRIPAAELKNHAVPRSAAYGVPPSSGQCKVIDGIIFMSEPGTVTMPPSMFLRLIRVAVEVGFDRQLEKALGRFKYDIALPTRDVRRLNGLVKARRARSAAGTVPLGRGRFTSMRLLALGRLLRAVVTNGGFDGALGIFKGFDAQFVVSLPSEVSNSTKRLLKDVSTNQTLNRFQTTVARRVMFSDCSCSPPPPPPPPPPPSCVETGDTGIMGCPH